MENALWRNSDPPRWVNFQTSEWITFTFSFTGVDDVNPLLFPDRYGNAISRFALDWLMRRNYGVKADLPTEKRHFHVLKHSIAVHLLDAGADLRFVQDWLGHADIGNTVIYATLTSKTRDEKARALFMKMPRL